MKIISSAFDSVILLEPKVFGDHRGFFMESYNYNVFAELGIDINFIQDNHSLSSEAGTLRGMHYQLNPKSQTKLVRVAVGAIYDVVVDIRKNSPTFGQWAGFILSSSNKRQLLVSKGFAHGFCTIEPNTEVLYKVDELYAPELDRGIAWNDPRLNIQWPVSEPRFSDKDSKHPYLQDAEINF